MFFSLISKKSTLFGKANPGSSSRNEPAKGKDGDTIATTTPYHGGVKAPPKLPAKVPITGGPVSTAIAPEAKPTDPVIMNVEPPSLPADNVDLMEIRAKLKALENALTSEKRLHEQAKTKLTQQNDQLKKLQASLEEAKQDKAELLQSSIETSRELNQFKRRGQVPNQLADGYIIDKAKGLRIQIRDFALLNFGDKVLDGHIRDKLTRVVDAGSSQLLEPFRFYMRGFPSPDVQACLSESADSRTAVIQLFLWAILHRDVFYMFYWASEQEGKSLSRVATFLRKF